MSDFNWVLEDSLATKKRGKPVYFQCMTGIGPKYTEKVADAEKFKDQHSAYQSPAYCHSLCFFEPKEVSPLLSRSK